MEPITSDPEFMMRFYQNALYLISLVFTFAALVGGCAYGLLIYSAYSSSPPRKIKLASRTAPELALANFKTAKGLLSQLPLASRPPLKATGPAISLLSARKAVSAL